MTKTVEMSRKATGAAETSLVIVEADDVDAYKAKHYSPTGRTWRDGKQVTDREKAHADRLAAEEDAAERKAKGPGARA